VPVRGPYLQHAVVDQSVAVAPVGLRLHVVRAITGPPEEDAAFERMSASNLRLKLIKVGAVIIRNTRRIKVLMSDAYPYKDEL